MSYKKKILLKLLALALKMLFQDSSVSIPFEKIILKGYIRLIDKGIIIHILEDTPFSS